MAPEEPHDYRPASKSGIRSSGAALPSANPTHGLDPLKEVSVVIVDLESLQQGEIRL
jgi:hypothetical protein